MIVCNCNNVSEEDIIKCGGTTVEEVQELTSACTNCQTCYLHVKSVIYKAIGESTNEGDN